MGYLKNGTPDQKDMAEDLIKFMVRNPDAETQENHDELLKKITKAEQKNFEDACERIRDLEEKNLLLRNHIDKLNKDLDNAYVNARYKRKFYDDGISALREELKMTKERIVDDVFDHLKKILNLYDIKKQREYMKLLDERGVVYYLECILDNCKHGFLKK